MFHYCSLQLLVFLRNIGDLWSSGVNGFFMIVVIASSYIFTGRPLPVSFLMNWFFSYCLQNELQERGEAQFGEGTICFFSLLFKVLFILFMNTTVFMNT